VPNYAGADKEIGHHVGGEDRHADKGDVVGGAVVGVSLFADRLG